MKTYTFQATPEEMATVAAALRERPGEAEDLVRCDIANRLERAHGEDDGLSAASSLMRAWYYGRVRDLAESVLEDILRGEVSDLGDYLHETVDSTDLVVYTWKASAVLFASDNEDAGKQELGEAPETVEGRAYWALLTDLREALSSMVDYPPEGTTLPDGFDLDDSDTWTASADAEA